MNDTLIFIQNVHHVFQLGKLFLIIFPCPSDHFKCLVLIVNMGDFTEPFIAVMHGDGLYSQWKDVNDCPRAFIDRLKHYFLTYKDLPDSNERLCEITHVYDKDEAFEVIRRAREDYKEKFSQLEDMMSILEDD